MAHGAAGMEDDPPRHAQAVVRLLSVHEERLVEAAERQEVRAADHHQRARRRRDVHRGGRSRRPRHPVLAAHDGGVGGDVESRRLDRLAVGGEQEPGADRHRGVVEEAGQRQVPARLDLAVEVDECDQPAARCLDAPVAARAEADVLLEAKRPGPCPVPRHLPPAVVSRPGVHHDALRFLGRRVPGERLERARQTAGAVVVDEHNRELQAPCRSAVSHRPRAVPGRPRP